MAEISRTKRRGDRCQWPVCYDLQGAELWRRELPIPVTQHGAGTSPIIAGELVLLNGDQDVGSHLLAVDKRLGRIVWRAERPDFRRGFSTPLLWPTNKPTEAVIAGTLRLVSYRLSDGVEHGASVDCPTKSWPRRSRPTD